MYANLTQADKLEAIRLLEERERLYRENALSRYQPYPKQREFHAAGLKHRERLFRAGNQGDALGYLQAVYSGAITGDPLRMNAAAVALKFERPALAATLQATMNVEMTPEQIDRRLAELIERAPPLLTAENMAEAAVAVEAETQSEQVT